VPTQAGAVLILLTKTVAINVVTLAYFRWLCMLVHALTLEATHPCAHLGLTTQQQGQQ
jgi:hypothetical protein